MKRRPSSSSRVRLRSSSGKPQPAVAAAASVPAGLLALATKVFGGAAAGRRWLNKPNAEFGWATPAEQARTAVGAKEVEVLLVGLHLRPFV